MSLDVGQRRQPAQLAPRTPARASVATRNSGTETTATARTLSDAVEQRAAPHRRRDAERERDRHREQRRSRAASSSEFGSRLADQLGHRQCVDQRHAGIAAAAGRRASAGSAAAPAGRGPSARAARPPPRAWRSWPSCSCAASPGSTPVMAKTIDRHRQQRTAGQRDAPGDQPQDQRGSWRRRHAGSARRARRARRSCSPSGRPVGIGARPFSLLVWASRLADEHRDADAALLVDHAPACRHTSACAWPRRSRRARRPAAGRTSRSSSAHSFQGASDLKNSVNSRSALGPRIDVAEAERVLHPVRSTSSRRPACA